MAQRPSGAQDHNLRQDPKHCFVPPYVGPSGWLGVRLDLGIPWRQVIPLVRIAYQRVAPARLRDIEVTGAAPPAPARRPTAAETDPWNAPRGKRLLASMRKICLPLPETSEDTQFGHPVWESANESSPRRPVTTIAGAPPSGSAFPRRPC